MSNDFFAYFKRMKHIKRWSLMYSSIVENDMEHTLEVTVIAHALALIGNRIYNKSYDIEKVLTYAMYHECSEVITGDLPTPVKYFNAEINSAYKDLEIRASKKLIDTLDEALKQDYENALLPDKESGEYVLVKCADKIAALIKCIDEVNVGNKEFKKAKSSIEKEVRKMPNEEVSYFLVHIMPSYSKTLDELD